jgi:hypothetical protein
VRAIQQFHVQSTWPGTEALCPQLYEWDILEADHPIPVESSYYCAPRHCCNSNLLETLSWSYQKATLNSEITEIMWDNRYLLVCLFLFVLQEWRWNPGTCSCLRSALWLSYTPHFPYHCLKCRIIYYTERDSKYMTYTSTWNRPLL